MNFEKKNPNKELIIMKIMSPFRSFIWTMTFYLRKFKVLDLVYTNKLLDCDSMKVYWNNNLLHKNEYLFKILQIH